MAKLGAASPLLMVLLTASAVYIHKLPPDDASIQPTQVTTPQLAVGAGKVMAALLLVVPPVPELAVVEPADCVPAQLASELVTATRA